MELHADVLGSIDFHEADRRFAIVINFRVGRIVADDHLVFLRKLDHALEVVLGHDDRRGIIRRVQPHQLGFSCHILGDRVQVR